MRARVYMHLLWRLFRTVRNWPVYFLNRYGFVRKEFAYKLWNGTVILSRPFAIDRSAPNDVWLDETYDPPHFGIPFDWAACKTILDIGAHIGTFTLFAASKAPGARIISLEPEPGNASMLRKNIAANHLDQRVKMTEAGIAPKPGTAEFHVSHASSGSNSMYHYTKDSHPITVQMRTLQSVFDEFGVGACDYLKLDCEGGEYDGLYGLRKDTIDRIKFMAIEYHRMSQEPTHTPQDLRAYLEKHGFTVIEPKKAIFYAYRPSATL